MVILIKTKKKERKKIYTQLGRSFSFFSHSFCLSNKKVPPHLFFFIFPAGAEQWPFTVTVSQL